MKKRILQLAARIITACICIGAANAATITVNTADNTDFSAGKTNLVRAINLLANGDTINFNIPNTTTNKHYLVTPPRVPNNGYPPITNNNVTIDGYSQPGASPNANPILAANSAQIRIVLNSTGDAGTVLDIDGYGLSESATLFVIHGTNVHIKGLCFLGPGPTVGGGTSGTVDDPSRYAISFGLNADYGHVSGCRIGLDLDGTTVHRFKDAVTVFGGSGTASSRTSIGVKPGPADATAARAQFNVLIGAFISLIFEGGTNYNVSGNFLNVYPDGVTDYGSDGTAPHNIESFIENGGSLNGVIGTDGDGLNDAEERNIFGGVTAANDDNLLEFYGGGTVNLKIAGNYFGIGVDGATRFTNSMTIVDNFKSGATAQFGSDFDGVSDDIEGNVIYMNNPFAVLFPDPPTAIAPPPFSFYDTGARVSFRGNKMINNNLAPFTYADGLNGKLNAFTNYAAPFMDVNSANGIIPVLNTTNIFPQLKGTFAVGINGYTTVVLDVYELDPEGTANGKLFQEQELLLPDGTHGGFPQGRRYLGSFTVPNTGAFDITVPVNSGAVTVTANYSQDPVGTHNGRVHTSNFSSPGYILPGGAASVGLTQIVPDVACWYDSVNNTVTNGFIILANQPAAATLGNWEPYIGQIGDGTFLVEFNTYANDGTLLHQNNVVAKQPAAGGAAKLGYCYYGDNGLPVKGIINFRRQNGNPGRVAGDLRYGGTKFITEAEASLGQIADFQTVPRWGNNNIYQGTAIFPENGNQAAAGNAYTAEQIFSLDPNTLAQTPVTNAWDYLYGNYVGVMGAANNAPQVGRTGGRPNFLDNGDIVVMADDKAAIVSTAGEVTTFSIIHPDGTIVKNATLAKAQDIFDNMCAVKGGFVIRVHNSMLFYDNSGSLTYSNDVNVSSGMNFGGSADVGGRGDGIRIGGDIRSYYVYLVGTVNGGGGSAELGLAAWDSRTGQFAGGTTVTDGDPTVEQSDRASVAVDGLNRVCATWAYKPDKIAFGYQAAARVAQFDGANFTWLTHTFFPFVNHDQNPNAILGYTTINPVVAMTTREICIAAKGTINNVNNVGAGPNSLTEQTVYTVISHPAPVAAPKPTLTITKSGSNVIVDWNVEEGLFTVQTKPSVGPGAWSNATAGNVAPPVTLPIGAGQLLIRLAR